MNIQILADKKALGIAAAKAGAEALREALFLKKEIAIIVATGASQFEMLQQLIIEPGIDWSCITVFHLDEYIGLPETHPASFRKYLQEIIAQLKRIEAGGEIDEEVFVPIRTMLDILDGFEERKKP